MKITTTVLATAALVLLQLVQMPMAGYTDPPTSATDPTDDPSSHYGYGYCPKVSCPKGFDLDYEYGSCKCIRKEDSYCPPGFYPFALEGGLCGCKRKSEPECKEGFDLDDDKCRCEFKKRPECPEYTKLWKYGGPDYCVGKHDPECPEGAWLLDNCTCSLRIIRKCNKGYLSADGCSCVEEAEPECDDHHGNKCQLNKKRCRCERRQDVWCYGKRYCRGKYYKVGHYDDCCEKGSSYRYNGRCYYC